MSLPLKKSSQRVFISYAHADQAQAKKLAEQLRSAKFETFIAEEALSTGDNWALEVGKALKNSDAIVVLVSKEFLDSPWATKEWEFALTSKKHAGRVLPVLMPGLSQASVPWIMERIQHVKSGANWNQTTRQVVSALRSLPGAA